MGKVPTHKGKQETARVWNKKERNTCYCLLTKSCSHHFLELTSKHTTRFQNIILKAESGELKIKELLSSRYLGAEEEDAVLEKAAHDVHLAFAHVYHGHSRWRGARSCQDKSIVICHKQGTGSVKNIGQILMWALSHILVQL